VQGHEALTHVLNTEIGGNSGLPITRHTRLLFQPIEKIGGGGWTRTNDLGIMRPSL
jgi:hypothetical protein